MEVLLSSAFDLLSSSDYNQIRRGVKHLEGVFAKLCLPDARPATGTGLSSLTEGRPSKPDDPAYVEFIKLQDGFEWNVASELLHVLLRVRGSNENSDAELVLRLLDLLQGTVLLHPASRRLFARTGHMAALLDLLNPGNPTSIHSASLLTLVSAMLDQPRNIRKFESLSGLRVVSELMRHKDTSKETKIKITEFLYFYVMPEQKPKMPTRDTSASTPSYMSAIEQWERYSKSAEDKQAMLRKYMPKAEGMVADLSPNVFQ